MRKPLPYNTQRELIARIKKEWGVFKTMYQITPSKWVKYAYKGKVHKDDFNAPRQNYYYNDAICRASPTMGECTEAFGDVGFTQKEKGAS